MKKLPDSWIKQSTKKSTQLSFSDVLFAESNKEDIFIENFIQTVKNLKFLRYRSQYSKLNRLKSLQVYDEYTKALEASCFLVVHLSKRSNKFKLRTEDSFITELITEKITWAPPEQIPISELKSHNANVSSKITGMFLANKPALRGCSLQVTKIVKAMEHAHNILHDI